MEGSSYNEDLKPRISTKKANQGITMKCIERIFDMVDKLNETQTAENNRKYTIECSFMQIY